MNDRSLANLAPVRLVVSLWFWLATGVVTLVWPVWLSLVYLATVPFDPGRYTVGRWFRRAAVVSAALNPLWRFRVSGVRIDDPRRPYVVVSNHEAFLDIWLCSHLPWEMKWLSKVENFRIPVMGWMMRMAGDIAVRRGDPRSRAEAVEECRDRLARRVSVMIFPEGTRSGTGDLLPFRDGAFRLAVETGVPILPLALAGTRTALRKGSLLVGPCRAEVRVLEPIETTGLGPEDIPALRDRVRERIAGARQALVREMEGSAAGEGSAEEAER